MQLAFSFCISPREKNKCKITEISHFLNFIYIQLNLYEARWFRSMSADETIESMESKAQYQLLLYTLWKGKVLMVFCLTCTL